MSQHSHESPLLGAGEGHPRRFPVDSAQWNHPRPVGEEYWERSVDWIWWSGAVILVIVIDAYVDAKLDDMRFKVEARASGGDVGVSLLVRY